MSIYIYKYTNYKYTIYFLYNRSKNCVAFWKSSAFCYEKPLAAGNYKKVYYRRKPLPIITWCPQNWTPPNPVPYLLLGLIRDKKFSLFSSKDLFSCINFSYLCK